MTKHASSPHARDYAGFRLGLLLHPAVVVEFLVGICPLVGIAFWGWDTFLVLMLHLLALALSAIWLVLRFATLSGPSLRYFGRVPSQRAPRGARWLYTGFALFTFGLPLTLFVAIIAMELREPAAAPIQGLFDFWQVVILSSGLWLPLALVGAWEMASFSADVVLPRLPLARRLRPPARPINRAYAALSPELQAFLYVRAFVVLRMIVTAFGVGIGLFLAGAFGLVVLAVILMVLKTAVAVLLEISPVMDAQPKA